mgnify:CR=1 FL=1
MTKKDTEKALLVLLTLGLLAFRMKGFLVIFRAGFIEFLKLYLVLIILLLLMFGHLGALFMNLQLELWLSTL